MKKGFTLVEIMIVVAIIALLAAIAIPNLLKQRIAANESAAQATLRTISAALETYAAANKGTYPDGTTVTIANLADKKKFDPPYINENYADGVVHQGYKFSVKTYGANYCIEAVPDSTTTGTTTFNITSGGVLTKAACP